MRKALEGNVTYKQMMQYASEDGNAGIKSHDWNMMIADLLAYDSNRKKASDHLRYWTYVRINDLKAGWNEGLFSVSYELKFARKDAVCVMIGGCTTVHECPDDHASTLGHVTNVHRDEAYMYAVQVSASHGLKLRDILSEIIVFRCYIVNQSGIKGMALATMIKTSDVKDAEVEEVLFDMEMWNDWEKATSENSVAAQHGNDAVEVLMHTT